MLDANKKRQDVEVAGTAPACKGFQKGCREDSRKGPVKQLINWVINIELFI